MPALSALDAAETIPNNLLFSRGLNETSDALQVICAWPVSGQYGTGTRVLYYVLIAACLVARREEWLVNPCLAAALVLPAVAAIHGIVLTAMHNPYAVDMDIFGAFQLCAIGILAAPVTVMLSKTYFNDPGRNTIFLWTFLLLIGLLSMTIEFYRIQTHDCTIDASGNPVSPNALKFNYVEGNNCNLICSTQDGPSSPLRGGSANNIYVIPAPHTLTFGTATLLAAACCVHAVLCLVSMWDRVLEINWRRRFGRQNDDAASEDDESANKGVMKKVNDTIGFFLRILAIPVFGGAGLAILIVGEINFFSPQVNYQTEPMANIDLEPTRPRSSISSRHRDPSIYEDQNQVARNPYRQRIENAFFRFGEMIGTPAEDFITEPKVKRPDRVDIPMIPGERFKSERFSAVEIERDQHQDQDDEISPVRSRPGSFIGSDASVQGVGRSTSMPIPPPPLAVTRPRSSTGPRTRPASLYH
ncbi:hypothetical protein FBEOM_7444 [Fusarium beomiforme]|uniref:Uncharacterized protein n=1 Tax=Fusarium beomiforme TaxID=44412 RepID=A0A9P5AH91_9HYPO|nr:hypothetical protein FBEOM_7444 [Fusarium beomiforme]